MASDADKFAEMDMANDVQREEWQCPNCKKLVRDYPALSRKDNTTEICSHCGQAQAMIDFLEHKEGARCCNNMHLIRRGYFIECIYCECCCLNVGKEDGGKTCWQHHDCNDGSCTHGE